MHNNISQTIFGDLFKRENNGYYLLWKSNFVISQIRTGLKRSNSVRYFGRIIWKLILEELKNMTSLNIFNKKKKKLDDGKLKTVHVEFVEITFGT